MKNKRRVPTLSPNEIALFTAIIKMGETPESIAKKAYENSPPVLKENKKNLKRFLNQLRKIGFIQKYRFDKYNCPQIWATPHTVTTLKLDDDTIETYLITSSLWFKMWDLLKKTPQPIDLLDKEFVSIVIYYTHNYVSHPTMHEDMLTYLTSLRILYEKEKLESKIKKPKKTNQKTKL